MKWQAPPMRANAISSWVKGIGALHEFVTQDEQVFKDQRWWGDTKNKKEDNYLQHLQLYHKFTYIVVQVD